MKKGKKRSMLGHGKCMFCPHTSLINPLSTCVYLCSKNKYRRNNHKSWMKSINNKLGKSGHQKLTFSIFICREVNLTIDVQAIEQRRPGKEKGNISITNDRKRWGRSILLCDEIRLLVVKSPWYLDPEDSLLSIYISKVI